MTHELFKHLNTDNTVHLLYKIHFVAYNITNDAPVPFIRFLFERDGMQFPVIAGPTNNLRQQCVDTFPEFKEVQYTGHIIYNKNVYVFVNILDILHSVQLQMCNSRLFCILDEILNHQHVMGNLRIQSSCIEFLFSYPAFYLLKNNNGTICEIPYVAFIGAEDVKQTAIDAYFGPPKTDYHHYILESFEDASSKKGGVIRYAVFGTTPLTENGHTKWLVESLDRVVSLSWSSVDKNTHFIS